MHDGTALPIFKNGEIVLRQVGDGVALLIDHPDIQLHQRCVRCDDIVRLLSSRADDGHRKNERKPGDSRDQSHQLCTAISECEKGHSIRNNSLDAGLGLSMPVTSESLQPSSTERRIAVLILRQCRTLRFFFAALRLCVRNPSLQKGAVHAKTPRRKDSQRQTKTLLVSYMDLDVSENSCSQTLPAR